MLTLVETIKEVCPKGFAEQDGKAQILVDMLDPASFHTISKYYCLYGSKLEDILATDRASSKKVKLY